MIPMIAGISRKIISTTYGDSRTAKKESLNRKLRKICRKECEMLENDLCRKEYAIAKRHPEIGRQVPLVECSDLPEEDTPEAADCMSIGISTENNVQESKRCFSCAFEQPESFVHPPAPKTKEKNKFRYHFFLQMTIVIGALETRIAVL
jgi:hypothetical protein